MNVGYRDGINSDEHVQSGDYNDGNCTKEDSDVIRAT